MTLNGAIMQLVEMRENSLMPAFFKPYFDKVIETVSECEEPSAQPEVRTDMSSANDTISRQAAISATWNALNVGDACKELRALPSEQSEIIYCKDCKWHGYNECFHRLGLIAAFDNNYCSYAERREE